MAGSRALKGAKFAIGGAQNTDLDQAGYEALTFVNVADIGSLGEFGATQTVNTYPVLDGPTLKAKGELNAGSTQVEYAYNSTDQGQIDLRAAGDDLTNQDYAIRITLNDGTSTTTPTTFYTRGVVTPSKQMGGGADDFIREMVQVDFQQKQIRVSPAAIA